MNGQGGVGVRPSGAGESLAPPRTIPAREPMKDTALAPGPYTLPPRDGSSQPVPA